jgi:hypothetical protein
MRTAFVFLLVALMILPAVITARIRVSRALRQRESEGQGRQE